MSPNIRYVTWDYEESSHPFYRIFSTDMEPGELNIGASLFMITTPETPEMDQKIADLCEAMQEVIASAVSLLRGG